MNYMATIIGIIAFIICWFWIELSFFFFNKFSKNYVSANNIKITKINKTKNISFIWYLRLIALFLLLLSSIYIYYFEKIEFSNLIQFCMGIIK